MGDSVEKPRLILASKSPRRKALLEEAGLSFWVMPSGIDEEKIPIKAPEIYVCDLALAKAAWIADRHPESWVLGADTIVCCDGHILGKPSTPTEAKTMLRRLSGRTHSVLTGLSFICRRLNREHMESVQTDVVFKELSEKEIEAYIQSGEPFDKAGAYAIQGSGGEFVQRIHGSYTNVVGLPVDEVMIYLAKEGVVSI